MPDTEHDAAVDYIVDKGVIRASNDSSDWVSAFKSDMVSFLTAIVSHAGSLIGATNISSNGGTISLNTSSSLDFKMVTSYDNQGNCTIKLVWGTSHEYILIDNFDLNRKYPIYWVIYKGVAISHTEGTSTVVGYAPDVMITMVRDSGVTLTGDVSSYTKPTEEEWVSIMDNLCLYNPAAFMIVNVINSLTNNQYGTGVVTFVGHSNLSPAETWEEYASWEPGYRMVPNNTSGNRIRDYLWLSEQGTTGHDPSTSNSVSQSLLLCGDMPYFPMPSAWNSYGYGCVTSDVAPIDYLAPMWSPTSACITANTRRTVWGSTLDQDGAGYGIPHRGPNVERIGDDYYLRCFDMWMPVAAPPESDQEPEE